MDDWATLVVGIENTVRGRLRKKLLAGSGFASGFQTEQAVDMAGLRLIRRVESGALPANPEAWLHQVAVNILRSEVKLDRLRFPESKSLGTSTRPLLDSYCGDEAATGHNRKVHLRRTLDQLIREGASAAILTDSEVTAVKMMRVSASTSEAARLAGMDRTNFKRTVSRAAKKISLYQARKQDPVTPSTRLEPASLV